MLRFFCAAAQSPSTVAFSLMTKPTSGTDCELRRRTARTATGTTAFYSRMLNTAMRNWPHNKTVLANHLRRVFVTSQSRV